MSVPPYEDPGRSRPAPKVDAGRLWTGGLATAAVTALVAVAGVLIARGLFEVPLENWGVRGGTPASDVDLGFEVGV